MSFIETLSQNSDIKFFVRDNSIKNHNNEVLQLMTGKPTIVIVSNSGLIYLNSFINNLEDIEPWVVFVCHNEDWSEVYVPEIRCQVQESHIPFCKCRNNGIDGLEEFLKADQNLIDELK